MRGTGPRAGRVVATGLASVVLAAGALAVATPTQAAIAAPTGLQAQVVSTKGVGLAWNPTGDDAYRVRFATNSSMTANDDTWDVRGRYLDWTHLDANPTVSSPRLSPGGTYYFQVKAVSDAVDYGDRKDLSSYSAPIKVTLPSSGQPELRPVRIRTTTAGPDSLYVSWPSRGPGLRYIVRYTTDRSQSVLDWRSTTFDTSGGVLTGLQPGTRYYLSVRAVTRDGKAVSDYSKVSESYAGTTATTDADPRISLVSYNVYKASGTPTWESRRKAVAATILEQEPDVVALQEATPLLYGDVKQYDDLVGLLGPDYALTTRAGSSGTKLVYDTTRLTVEDAGTQALTTIGSATRYASWAVFEHRRSGKDFFVIDTHLEPGDDNASTNAARIQQAKEVLALVDEHSRDLPVVIAGDMNSSRNATPANGQYDVFTGAGYIDPTANATSSFSSGYGAPVEHAMDWAYNSANKFASKPKRTAYPVGTNIDYVFTSPGLRVATWRTVVDVDTNGAFVGTIPSDHNALALNLHLGGTAAPEPTPLPDQDVTAAPTLTMEPYQAPPKAGTDAGTTDIDVTWRSGGLDYSGVVKLQYWSSGSWRTYGSWVEVGPDGTGSLTVPFQSSKTWRAYGARLDGVHRSGQRVASGTTAKTPSADRIVTVRSASPTTTPRLYVTSMARSGTSVPMLVSWNRPGGTFRLQYKSGSSWTTHSTYRIPSDGTQLFIENTIRTSKSWRIATSTGSLKISGTMSLTML